VSNSLPFGDSDQISEDEIAKRVEGGVFTMSGPAWGSVSDDAKDFVEHLLVLREKKRPTAEKALQHKWLSQGAKQGEDAAAVSAPLKLKGDQGAMDAMSNFRK